MLNCKKITGTVVGGMLLASPLFAIDSDLIEWHGYGTVYYSNYDYLKNYQSPVKNRSKVDLERVVIAPTFILSDNIKLVTEFEFEHGGTGVTMEYDTLEEFGEFEMEVEKGGEIIVEEAYLDFTYKPWLNFKVGHMIVPVGVNSQRHLPNTYLSTRRNLSEITILPNTWHETGVTAYGEFAENFHYQAMLMTGLNSEYFNSAQWIKAGHQKHFESVNADALAGAVRVDYGNLVGSNIGASVYVGNTNKNRQKNQINPKGTVTIAELHGIYDEENIRLRGMFLWGHLSDSMAISLANKNLPNALEAKGSPVGSEAISAFVEAGYDIAPMLDHDSSLIPFVKYDFVNSMHKTEGIIQKNGRYKRTMITGGLDYFYTPTIVFKTDYTVTSFGKSSMKDMDTFTISLGYQF